MDYSKIEKDVEEFVRNTYTGSSVKPFPYHNLAHTLEVVGHATEIGEYYLLSAPELFIVRVAAWFHDIGHLTGEMEGHEERGIAIMQGCLGPLLVSGTLISTMSDCIRATKYPSYPHNLYEEILCDADTFHFGTPKFRMTDGLVKEEVELRTGKSYADWHAKSIKLLEDHRFFTAYCKKLLTAGKLENIQWLKSLKS